MPKRIKHPKRPTDINQFAHQLVQQSTAEPEPPVNDSPGLTSISEYMAAIGRKGGKIGGKRRLATMTASRRKKMHRRQPRLDGLKNPRTQSTKEGLKWQSVLLDWPQILITRTRSAPRPSLMTGHTATGQINLSPVKNSSM
jgi:hypothetical protein